MGELPTEVAEVLAGTRRWAVVNSDCRDVIAALPARSIPLVIADAPYSSGARRDAERTTRGSMLREVSDADWFSHDEMTTWGFSWFLRGVLTTLLQKLEPGAHVYLFCDWRQLPNVYGLAESAGYRVNHCLVWDKETFGMGTYWRNQHEHIVFCSAGQPAPVLSRACGSVLRARGVRYDERVHPTEKPPELIEQILEAAPGNLALDLFCGSGSTGVAALRRGRRFLGCDIASEHAITARDRLAAEVDGSTLQARRAGQVPMFGGGS